MTLLAKYGSNRFGAVFSFHPANSSHLLHSPSQLVSPPKENLTSASSPENLACMQYQSFKGSKEDWDCTQAMRFKQPSNILWWWNNILAMVLSFIRNQDGKSHYWLFKGVLSYCSVQLTETIKEALISISLATSSSSSESESEEELLLVGESIVVFKLELDLTWACKIQLIINIW